MGLTRAAEDRPTPPAIYNIRIYGLALLACIGSWMFGYNVGVIGGTIVLPSFFNDFHLPPVGSSAYNNITSNIISLLQIGGLAGSLCMFFGMRRYGRKLALAACAGVYLVGAILQTISYGNLDMMYIGRLITGIGAGGGTVVVPLYLAELSPPAIRGSIVGIYEINNQLSSLVGYWCNYIVNLYIPSTSTRQWQIPLAMQIVPSTVLFVVAIFILPESPRFLVSKDKSAKARRILSFVRHLPEDHEYINSEIADFEEAHQGQERARESQKGRLGMVRELGWKGNRNRVVIGLGLMIGQNFTGINGVNFYTPTIFRSIGVEGTNTILLASGMYAAVKTIATLCSLIFLIDRAGRRKLLLISAVGVSASLWYIGAYITAAHIDLSKSQPVTKTGGSWIAIICVYLYAASFSIAWNGVVWVYCSEIFPGRIKDLAVCMTTGTQWLTQFAVARASPYMLSSLKGGFFFFFASCMVVAGVGVWFFVPETKGVGLERMDRIFGSPYDGRNGIGDLEAAGREEENKISKDGDGDVDVDVDGDGDVEKGGQRVVAEQQHGLEISISRVRSTRMEQVGISGMGQTV